MADIFRINESLPVRVSGVTIGYIPGAGFSINRENVKTVESEVIMSNLITDRLQENLDVFSPGKTVVRVDSDRTIYAYESGTTFLAHAAAQFTLPSPNTTGINFTFLQKADATMRILGSSNIIHKGNSGASSISFQTASQKLGSSLHVISLEAEGMIYWYAFNLGGTTATVS